MAMEEFGHNDGGSLTPTDNGRSDWLVRSCLSHLSTTSISLLKRHSPGAGTQTCSTTYNGVAETVLTYPAYQLNAIKLMVAKGAHVILSGPTPDNPWETVRTFL